MKLDVAKLKLKKGYKYLIFLPFGMEMKNLDRVLHEFNTTIVGVNAGCFSSSIIVIEYEDTR